MKKLNITIPFDYLVFGVGITLTTYGLVYSKIHIYGFGAFCLGLSIGYSLKEELARLKSILSKSKSWR